jgi:transposase
MPAESAFVGIDVAKASLEVAVHSTGERWTLPYSEPAVATLVDRLAALAPTLLVVEATGGLEEIDSCHRRTSSSSSPMSTAAG